MNYRVWRGSSLKSKVGYNQFMRIFRRQLFRIFARLLVVSVMLGTTAAVWASVDAALSTNDVASSKCPMQQQSDDQHSGHTSCCQESGDCIGHCGTCAVSYTSTVNYFSHSINSFISSNTQFLPQRTNLPEGLSAGPLYRPPIFSA